MSPLLAELARDLAEAVRRDEDEGDGFDLSAGLFGTHVSSWLRAVAKTIDPCHDVEEAETFCSLCHAKQFSTPSGLTCANGHGGAPGYTKEQK